MKTATMLVGGCQCGAVRFESKGKIGRLFVCHCKECQKLAASAFSLSLEVERYGFRVVKGAPTFWTRQIKEGAKLSCGFCPTCGSRLWHWPSNDPETVIIKAGALDPPPDISRAIHIWTSRRLAGVVIPDGVEQWPMDYGVKPPPPKAARPIRSIMRN